MKGSFASSGVVGVWAGPRTPGTAYNLLHHSVGEVNGVVGAWGQVQGGMGGVSEAVARAARAAGADIRTSAAVAGVDVAGGRVRGVTLESGERMEAPVVASGIHPRTLVLDLVGRGHWPGEVVRDMERFRTRGGRGQDQHGRLGAAALARDRGRRTSSGCGATATSPCARRSSTWSARGSRRRSARCRPSAATSRC